MIQGNKLNNYSAKNNPQGGEHGDACGTGYEAALEAGYGAVHEAWHVAGPVIMQPL